MPRKTITLKGAAAKAFLGLSSGEIQTEDEVLASAATLISMNVQTGDMPKAVQILKGLLANRKPMLSENTNWPSNGLYCPVCRQPQINTPSGTCCLNGHGGLEGVEKSTDHEP